MLGLIFRKAQNKIQDPAKLRQLIVELIGKEEWLAMSSDVKGDAYEGLLKQGPPSGHVDRLERIEADSREGFKDFEIRFG